MTGWAIVATAVGLAVAVALASTLIIAASTGGSILATSAAWAGIGGSSIGVGCIVGFLGGAFILSAYLERNKLISGFDAKKWVREDLASVEKKRDDAASEVAQKANECNKANEKKADLESQVRAFKSLLPS